MSQNWAFLVPSHEKPKQNQVFLVSHVKSLNSSSPNWLSWFPNTKSPDQNIPSCCKTGKVPFFPLCSQTIADELLGRAQWESLVLGDVLFEACVGFAEKSKMVINCLGPVLGNHHSPHLGTGKPNFVILCLGCKVGNRIALSYERFGVVELESPIS